MFAYPVKKVTFTCPHCKTSITFDIPECDFKELFEVTARLTCPKCLESLSSDARSMAHAIYEYNKAAEALNAAEENTHSKLA